LAAVALLLTWLLPIRLSDLEEAAPHSWD